MIRPGGRPAEHNLIQAPELTRRLFNRLGIRQSHVAPTLNEGVQAVVIVDDVREVDQPQSTSTVQRYAVLSGATPDAINVAGFQLFNPQPGQVDALLFPLGADQRRVMVRVRRMVFDNQKIGASIACGILWGPRFGVVSGVGGQSVVAMRSMQRMQDGTGAPEFAHSGGILTINGIAATPGPGVSMGRVQVPADGTVIIDWPRADSPCVPPGWCWVVKQNTTNGDVDFTIEWDEEPILEAK